MPNSLVVGVVTASPHCTCQPDLLPVECHSYKKKCVYLKGKRIAVMFQESMKSFHPRMSKADLSRYSAHSLRVWACVLLDKAGMSPEFIMSCLRRMGNSFQMYLCNTRIIQDKHHKILQAASPGLWQTLTTWKKCQL